MLQRGHSGDRYDLASTLYKYDLSTGDLFILSLARAGEYHFRAANVCGGVRSILLLPLVARCLETIDVCIWCMFVFISVVWGGGLWECLLCSGCC